MPGAERVIPQDCFDQQGNEQKYEYHSNSGQHTDDVYVQNTGRFFGFRRVRFPVGVQSAGGWGGQERIVGGSKSYAHGSNLCTVVEICDPRGFLFLFGGIGDLRFGIFKGGSSGKDNKIFPIQCQKRL